MYNFIFLKINTFITTQINRQKLYKKITNSNLRQFIKNSEQTSETWFIRIKEPISKHFYKMDGVTRDSEQFV